MPAPPPISDYVAQWPGARRAARHRTAQRSGEAARGLTKVAVLFAAVGWRACLAITRRAFFCAPTVGCGLQTNPASLKGIGAAKRTRTSTPVKELAPQASASTSSAMAALFVLR